MFRNYVEHSIGRVRGPPSDEVVMSVHYTIGFEERAQRLTITVHGGVIQYELTSPTKFSAFLRFEPHPGFHCPHGCPDTLYFTDETPMVRIGVLDKRNALWNGSAFATIGICERE